MFTLTTQPPVVRVDWTWTVSVERVLGAVPDLLTWADAPSSASRDQRPPLAGLDLSDLGRSSLGRPARGSDPQCAASPS